MLIKVDDQTYIETDGIKGVQEIEGETEDSPQTIVSYPGCEIICHVWITEVIGALNDAGVPTKPGAEE